jgi:hypothetical protein
MKYQLRIVLTPLCGKLDERLFPYDEIELKYNADKGYVRIDDKESNKLLFLAPMDSIAYMERVEIK